MAADGAPGSPPVSMPPVSMPAAAGSPPAGGIEVLRRDEVTVVRFWGAVDLAVRLAATTELRRVPDDDATALDVDCRDVTFMDSTGLSVLVRVLRDADAQGRAVRFLGATPQVQDLLSATGVDRWMESLGVRRVG
jgi:anti-anti-sigma factor